MSIDLINVVAEVKLLATAEGGKTIGIRGSYRPNHNFFDSDDTGMTVGVLKIPRGVEVKPGEAITLPITFMWWPALAGQIYAGREWRIQEGRKLIGIGRILEVQGGGF